MFSVHKQACLGPIISRHCNLGIKISIHFLTSALYSTQISDRSDLFRSRTCSAVFWETKEQDQCRLYSGGNIGDLAEKDTIIPQPGGEGWGGIYIIHYTVGGGGGGTAERPAELAGHYADITWALFGLMCSEMLTYPALYNIPARYFLPVSNPIRL